MATQSSVQELRPVVIYGGGGHAKVLHDLVLQSPHLRLLGVLDDRLAPGQPSPFGPLVLGGMGWLEAEGARRGVGVVLAIGDNAVRQRLGVRCRELGCAPVTVVHASAVVSSSATLGEGVAVMPGVVVNASATIGEGAILNSGCVVEHDCVVGAYAHVSPNAAMGGAARLGSQSHLGLGAVILPGITVGDRTVVGAGAVVNRALPDGVVALGVPARVRHSSS